jgi:hypothetical protein
VQQEDHLHGAGVNLGQALLGNSDGNVGKGKEITAGQVRRIPLGGGPVIIGS